MIFIPPFHIRPFRGPIQVTAYVNDYFLRSVFLYCIGVMFFFYFRTTKQFRRSSAGYVQRRRRTGHHLEQKEGTKMKNALAMGCSYDFLNESILDS